MRQILRLQPNPELPSDVNQSESRAQLVHRQPRLVRYVPTRDAESVLVIDPLALRWFQYLNIIGCHDLNGLYDVLEAVRWSCEFDFVAQSNIVERAKKSVPVTGQNDISVFSRQSRC